MADIAGLIELHWHSAALWLITGSAVVFALVSLYRTSCMRADFESRFSSLEKQLKVVVSGAVGMGEHVVRLEAELKRLRENHNQAVEAEANYSYSQAVKLIEQGVDSATVAASCGLSDCEIQLMELVHGNSRRAVSA